MGQQVKTAVNTEGGFISQGGSTAVCFTTTHPTGFHLGGTSCFSRPRSQLQVNRWYPDQGPIGPNKSPCLQR